MKKISVVLILSLLALNSTQPIIAVEAQNTQQPGKEEKQEIVQTEKQEVKADAKARSLWGRETERVNVLPICGIIVLTPLLLTIGLVILPLAIPVSIIYGIYLIIKSVL